MDREVEGEMDLLSEEFLPAEKIAADIIFEPQPVLQCMRIGPLSKREEADKLSLNLFALGLLPELHSEISNEQEGYWALVPPQKNRATAVSIVRQLREAGVTDLWRFTSGSLAHAISLGLFRNERRAEIRKRQIEKKGFDVEVRPRYHQKTRYWLGFVISGDSPVTEAKWGELVKSFPEIEREVVDCQEIATR
jgi:cell division protein FtsN